MPFPHHPKAGQACYEVMLVTQVFMCNPYISAVLQVAVVALMSSSTYMEAGLGLGGALLTPKGKDLPVLCGFGVGIGQSHPSGAVSSIFRSMGPLLKHNCLVTETPPS